MRHHRQLFGAASLFALAVASAAGAYSAHPPQPIGIGDEIAGEITADDQFIGGEDMSDDAPEVALPLQHYDQYMFEARAGQRLEIIMRSDAFDSYLEIGHDGEILASDDDGLGEGVNSRLRFTAPADGSYFLTARPLYAEGGAGPYTLSIHERPPTAPAPAPTPVRMGDTVEGALDSGDPESERGPFYDAYSLDVRQGDQIWITQTSDAFDTYLQVGRPNAAGVFEEVAVSDDWGGSLNSGLLFIAPETGRYLVRASSYSTSEGPYTLVLSDPPPPTRADPIAIGQQLDGELTETDPQTPDEYRHDAWRFHVAAGQRVAIEMRSDSFDTYLVLGREVPGGFEAFAEDDDGMGESLNSRLTWQFDEAGDYVIQARGFRADALGAYSLSLAEIAPPPPPTPLAFSDTVQGEITATDAEVDYGRRADNYLFSGVAGQRIQAIMRSGDFDSYLEIGHGDGEFSALASDDDGLGEGLDSRLNFTLPETGDYVLRAGPLGATGLGLYALQLVDRGPEPAPGSVLVGETARGTLEETDSISEDGSYFDAWRFRAREGDKLRMTMVSNEFDAVLLLGTQPEGGLFEMIASDDDSLSDTQAMIDHTIPADGWYVLRARSYSPGRTGYYSIAVERQP